MEEIKTLLLILLLNKKWKSQLKSQSIYGQNLMSSSWLNSVTLPGASFSSGSKAVIWKWRYFSAEKRSCNFYDSSPFYSSVRCASYRSPQCPVVLQDTLQEWGLTSGHSCRAACGSNVNKADFFLSGISPALKTTAGLSFKFHLLFQSCCSLRRSS